MQTYKVEATVPGDGTLKIKDHPFPAGERVEIVVRNHNGQNDGSGDRYPLRGKPVRFAKPFESVASEDRDALK
ncbi:MAG: hypothetical protein QF437_11675 [Planctomycetota bacterium]|jgi:hypothetical protein|nr:hypothetical protein [Planctomycetota bacterium]MDP7131144.1 hypothetical protein [Planctomycetota bacterium]MDP7252132.1 hypothetical protein [Planctomycetota bacterium]